MIRIVMADDDVIVREGLKIILEMQPDFELVGVGQNGLEAVKLCRKRKPDIILMDIRMPDMDGIAASEIILKEELSKPLLLTTFDEEDLIFRALKAGVSGYILKNSPPDRIFSAIRAVYNGGTVFQPDIVEYIRSRVSTISPDTSSFELLSEREMEVVRLIAKGYSNNQIAEELFLSLGTVKNRISV
ncbi:MAG: response regulator transcription factor, partial [Fibrobacter sp.]|nr:response regulator transcription factor [Fibrobacter sp.]